MNHMYKCVLLFSSLVLGSLALSAQVANQQTQLQRSTLLRSEVSFIFNGRTAKAPVMIEQMILDSRQRVRLELPIKGLWFIQLKGGEAIVTIDGKKAEFNTDDFLVINSTSECIIQTEDDSVIIQVYAIGNEYLQNVKNKPVRSTYTKSESNYKEVVSNAFVKDAYSLGDTKRPQAIVRDINVGPGKKTGALKFEGPAVIQVLSGEGILAIDERESRSSLGTTLAINEGSALVINNTSKKRTPFKLRALVYQK